jgi:hypothetical protein
MSSSAKTVAYPDPLFAVFMVFFFGLLLLSFIFVPFTMMFKVNENATTTNQS